MPIVLIKSAFLCLLYGAQPDTIFFNKLLATDCKFILDVQPNHFYKENHINGAYNAPTITELKALCDTIDRSVPIFVYCMSGERSKIAVGILRDMGFAFVFEMLRGIEGFYQTDIWEDFRIHLVRE